MLEKKHVFQKNNFNHAPVHRVAFAMKYSSAFTGSYAENPFWYHQLELRQIEKLRRDQPIVDFHAADNFRLHNTTRKAMNFQDVIPSIPVGISKNHHVLVFVLTSIQDATQNCHHPELVGELLRLNLETKFPVEQVTGLIVLGERISSVAVDKFGVVGKNS